MPLHCVKEPLVQHLQQQQHSLEQQASATSPTVAQQHMPSQKQPLWVLKLPAVMAALQQSLQILSAFLLSLIRPHPRSRNALGQQHRGHSSTLCNTKRHIPLLHPTGSLWWADQGSMQGWIRRWVWKHACAPGSVGAMTWGLHSMDGM